MKGRFGTYVKRFFIGWFFLAVMVAVFSSDDDYVVKNSSADGDLVFNLDESINLGDVNVAIISSASKRKFSDSFGILTAEAQRGATLVAVIARYRNVGNKPISPFTLPQLSLYSPSGVEYESDLGKSAAVAGIYEIDQKVVSDINPGLASEDVFVFEVDTGSLRQGGWTISIDGVKDARYAFN